MKNKGTVYVYLTGNEIPYKCINGVTKINENDKSFSLIIKGGKNKLIFSKPEHTYIKER